MMTMKAKIGNTRGITCESVNWGIFYIAGRNISFHIQYVIFYFVSLEIGTGSFKLI